MTQVLADKPLAAGELATTARIALPVEGMTCTSCLGRVEAALNALPIQSASVNLALNRADIRFDPAQTNAKQLRTAVEDAGYEVPTDHLTLAIEGMTCASCAGRVERALDAVPGVVEATVNLAVDKADIAFVGTSPQALTEAVREAGYSVVDEDTSSEIGDAARQREAREQAHVKRETGVLAVSALITLPFVIQMAAMPLGFGWHLPPYLEFALATPVQFWIGSRFYRGAWKALKARTANMDVLVAMGTSAAYFYSLGLLLAEGSAASGRLYFEAAAVIVTLILAGKVLESRAKRSTAAAIRELMSLRPERARVVREGREEEIPINAVLVADIVLVRPGEKVPVDGVVIEGSSETDESLVTGESLPVAKLPNDHVIGGSVNGTGLLRVEATAVGQDSTLSRIIRLVENAQVGKAPIQRLVDRISQIFVPIVIAIATATLLGWLVAGGTFEHALIAAVSVLVIACPCALGLATPTAIVAGTGAAAKSGILIKDIEALERAHKVDTVVFDKTGTLTVGRPNISDIIVAGRDRSDVLAMAASAQFGSEHPLARAFIAKAEEEGIALEPVSGFLSQPGRGITATVAGHSVAVGNRALLQELEIACDSLEDSLATLEESGRAAVVVAVDAIAWAVVGIADPVRPESAMAVKALNTRGKATLMLTGDSEPVARRVATDIGLDDFIGPIRPEDKSREIKRLQALGKVVAMVGDGINDAPALATADVGIAMGTGTDVAMETAGVTLMRPDPRLVSAAIDVSGATLSKIRQNLFWAFFYNVVCIPLAALGFLSPAVAGAAMAFSSVSVVTNSLFLKRWKPSI